MMGQDEGPIHEVGWEPNRQYDDICLGGEGLRRPPTPCVDDPRPVWNWLSVKMYLLQHTLPSTPSSSHATNTIVKQGALL